MFFNSVYIYISIKSAVIGCQTCYPSDLVLLKKNAKKVEDNGELIMLLCVLIPPIRQL